MVAVPLALVVRYAGHVGPQEIYPKFDVAGLILGDVVYREREYGHPRVVTYFLELGHGEALYHYLADKEFSVPAGVFQCGYDQGAHRVARWLNVAHHVAQITREELDMTRLVRYL